jgi:hypothetical protein
VRAKPSGGELNPSFRIGRRLARGLPWKKRMPPGPLPASDFRSTEDMGPVGHRTAN